MSKQESIRTIVRNLCELMKRTISIQGFNRSIPTSCLSHLFYKVNEDTGNQWELSTKLHCIILQSITNYILHVKELVFKLIPVLSVTYAHLLVTRQPSTFVRVGRKKPQKLTQLSPDLIQDISWKKRTAQKDAIKDITSESQVNNYFPYRCSPASKHNKHLFLFI